MPQPRKPAARQELSGSWKKNPQRRREEPEVTAPIGTPPKALSAGAKQAWREITKHANWLTAADRHILEITCVMIDQSRRDELPVTAMTQLRGALGQLGLTPADRSKVPAGKKKEKPNPFEGLGGNAAH